MDEKASIISAIPIFKGLQEGKLSDLAEIAVEKHFSKGQIIFLEGDEGKGFFVVYSGFVKIYKISSEGKEKILRLVKPRDIFGPVPLFSGETYPASADAMKPTKALFFPRDGFINLIKKNPDIALNILDALSDRLRQFTIQVEDLSLKEIPSRLATYFLHVSKEESRNDAFTLEIPKGQLASLLGTIPETLSRIFSKMREAGIIESEGKKVKILNMESLKNLAEGAKLF
ncbi:MAG: Crp/Fnr family transcriptional regulator [Deltaproteobacteria bacterium]|nr:Crp/Fnr family transcriptional regulator [Deltaproteobacteria bacterium]MBW2333853.1 Crp/Fnr family transcriptional regulator [Deltaproteobacteria bacterium]